MGDFGTGGFVQGAIILGLCPGVFCMGVMTKTRLFSFLISYSIQEWVVESNIIPSVQSAHSAIVLKFSPTSESERVCSYQKFNNSLPDDKDCVENLKGKFRHIVWNALKPQLPMQDAR